jgi:ankyrin repeat protein
MPLSFEAANKQNDSTTVYKSLIGPNPLPVDIRNEASQTGLMIACAHNKTSETLKVILDQHPSLETEDTLGWTAIHYAAKNGNLECLKLLIEHKANIDATTYKNETALFLATKYSQLKIVQFLAKHACQLQTKALCKNPENDATKEELTALEFAVAENSVEIAMCLLFHLTSKKELNDEDLNELLLSAAGTGQTEIAGELLNNGANVNHQTRGTISFFMVLFGLQIQLRFDTKPVSGFAAFLLQDIVTNTK